MNLTTRNTLTASLLAAATIFVPTKTFATGNTTPNANMEGGAKCDHGNFMNGSWEILMPYNEPNITVQAKATAGIITTIINLQPYANMTPAGKQDLEAGIDRYATLAVTVGCPNQPSPGTIKIQHQYQQVHTPK